MIHIMEYIVQKALLFNGIHLLDGYGLVWPSHYGGGPPKFGQCVKLAFIQMKGVYSALVVLWPRPSLLPVIGSMSSQVKEGRHKMKNAVL